MRSALACLVAFAALPASSRADGPVDYARDVKPILAGQSVSYHGESKPKAGLRLDTAAAAIKGDKAGPSVVPGHSDESPLSLALAGPGVTPMPLKRPTLPADQIEASRAWIDAGAPADEVASVPPTRWYFVPPRKPEPPAVRGASHSDDRFIRAPLERDRIAPSPEADRTTLIRRVSLDLVGLPPTPAEVDAFLADGGQTGPRVCLAWNPCAEPGPTPVSTDLSRAMHYCPASISADFVARH
jgi:Protein of unknown function (DUF1549)/Planctomycete cytochrome C